MGTDGIIFIPGMMCDERLFEPQIEVLRKTNSIEVALPTRDETVEDAARRVLEETKFRCFSLVGLSLGGIVAMEMMRQQPDRIERVALLDTNHLADTPDRVAQRLAQIAEVRNGGLVDVMMNQQKPFYVAPKNMGDPALNSIFMSMATDLGPEVFERQSRMLIGRGSAENALQRYKKPALVLCGEHDKPCPVSRHQQIQSLLDFSELVVVLNAGHITTLEEPEAVTTALERWLQAEV